MKKMNQEKHTILYIDDEEINLRLFKTTFRREYRVITARDASEGMEMLSREKIDLIITDQRMPGITGVEFLKMVQERWPGIPPGRLIISGYSDPEDIDRAYKHYQLYRFIAKPWKETELNEIIKKAIENE